MRKVFVVSAALALVVVGAGRVLAEDDAKAIIKKGIAAYGGADKLAKLKAARAGMKGTIHVNEGQFEFTGTILNQGPDQLKIDIEMEVMGQKVTFVQALNKDKGWMSVMGMTMDVTGDALAELKDEAYGNYIEGLVPLLSDKNIKLELVGETQVKGKAAVGVKVTSKGRKEVDLYFDKTTGQIVKSQRRALDQNKKEVNQETFYSDFKETDGVKSPMKLEVLQDGKELLKAEITEVKFLDKIDDSEFAKP